MDILSEHQLLLGNFFVCSKDIRTIVLYYVYLMTSIRFDVNSRRIQLLLYIGEETTRTIFRELFSHFLSNKVHIAHCQNYFQTLFMELMFKCLIKLWSSLSFSTLMLQQCFKIGLVDCLC